MNRELEQAIQHLREKDYSCVIWIAGQEPVCSREIGVKPLMTELRKDRNAFREGVIADRVVGKAAALMMILGGAQAVYGEVMSEPAKKILETYKVEYGYHTLVPYIENRTKTGQCPLEEAVLEVECPEEAFDVLEQKIQMLMEGRDG